MLETVDPVPYPADVKRDPALRFIGSGSPMRDLIRTYDWFATSLGPIAAWPTSLKTVVGIMMNSVHPMFLWWGENLVQLYNDAYMPSLCQGKHPQAIGQTAAACWPEIWPIIWPQIENVLNGGAAAWYQDNLVPILRDGRLDEVYWSYTYTPIVDEAGNIPGVLVLCNETTKNVLAERRRKTLDLLNQGIIDCNSETAILHQVQLAASSNPNDIVAVYTGHNIDSRENNSQVTISAAELNLAVDLTLTFRISQDTPFDRAYRQFLEQFTVIAAAACIRIENDTVQAVAAAERDRLLLDAPVGTAIIIGENLVYHLANPLYCQISGRDVSTIVGKPFTDVFPELSGSRVHQVFNTVYKTGTPYISAETLVRLRLNGGELENRYYTYNLAPLRRLDDSVYGLMVIAVDITHQVSARNEIERLNSDLNVSLRAKDEFLAMLGHELRNPLAPIVTALALMKLQETSTEREQAIIDRQVTHLMRLVDDLLDVSRITRGKVELRNATVNLQNVLGKSIEMASHLLEQRKHRLTVDIPSITWYGDPARLAQVVANLLTNAAHYTPEHGDIELTAHVEDNTVKIQVRDNGIGISAKLLPHIYDAFVQGERTFDRAAGGLGIGLALVKNLVEMHAGQVTAHSGGKGQGSTFIITLPLPAVTHPLPVAASGSPVAITNPGTGLRIMVVDDNRDAADSLAELLDLLGHHATVAYDPVEAIEESSRSMPDLAILDIGLPGMNGYELAQHLRMLPQGKQLTLVALTGYGQENDKTRSQSAGFATHLVKPIDLAALQNILNSPLN